MRTAARHADERLRTSGGADVRTDELTVGEPDDEHARTRCSTCIQ